MPSLLPKDVVVTALASEFAVFEQLLSELPVEQWSLPTACPGWDVQAQVAHVVGTESMLAGVAAPEVDVDREVRPHVRNDIGGFNEGWVVALSEVEPIEVLRKYREITSSRLRWLRELDQGAWEKEGFTPAGTDTYGRFMRIRVFDVWMHEQDVREAVSRPGHDSGPAVEMALDEITASLGFVVAKRAGAPRGASVTFSLTGGAARTIHVVVDERAIVVDELATPATVTVRMPVVPFTRLVGGRAGAPTELAELSGDEELGRRILEQLGYVI